MEGFAAHLSPLTKFAMAIALSVVLPKVMERLRLPAVFGFIVTGTILTERFARRIKDELASEPEPPASLIPTTTSAPV